MTTRPTTASNAAEIEALKQRLAAAEELFGANSQTAGNIREEIASALAIAKKAETTAKLALKKGEQTRRLLDVLGTRVAEDHDSLVFLIKRLETLEAGGGGTNFASLVAAGFTADERAAIMTLAGQDGGDDQFVAALIMGLRTELKGLGDVVADHSNRLVKVEDGQTSLTGRVNSLESAHGELKVQVAAIASANGGSRGVPRWGLGLIVGVIAALTAGLIAYHWADLSAGWSWFTAAVVGGASFWLASSFEKEGSAPSAFAAGYASARSSKTTPTTQVNVTQANPAPAGTSA